MFQLQKESIALEFHNLYSLEIFLSSHSLLSISMAYIYKIWQKTYDIRLFELEYFAEHKDLEL